MARRVTRRVEHDDGAVAEDILVAGQRLRFSTAADPIGERRGTRSRSLRVSQEIPVAFSYQQRRLRK